MTPSLVRSVRTVCATGAAYSIYKEYLSNRESRRDTKVWLKVLFQVLFGMVGGIQ